MKHATGQICQLLEAYIAALRMCCSAACNNNASYSIVYNMSKVSGQSQWKEAGAAVTLWQ